MIAVRKSNLDIVREFDKVASADFCTTNKDGKTPIEILKERLANNDDDNEDGCDDTFVLEDSSDDELKFDLESGDSFDIFISAKITGISIGLAAFSLVHLF